MALIQYIVVRCDLNWPLGALIAQGCHASVAALTKFKEHDFTKSYLQDLENMHKVVLKADEAQLTEIVTKLTNNNIDFYLWKEMPENITSALATRPYYKQDIHPFLKHLKLYS
ncbi:putative peptidyl-tRNA hydrolase PTRHD1 [Tetranychus urticae]|uniref:peptidyl-tRNA hydrolase n=1 Tax=Tetranychus urticae TaxID=32264 RepID=T1L231_TETUR|nr:putative peptidyl-tRNA hydrolase PTRHD1 [Tetranychus urticae]